MKVMSKLKPWWGQYRGHIALWATMATLLLLVDAFDWNNLRAALDQLAILLGFAAAFAVETLFAAAKREAEELDRERVAQKRAANIAYGRFGDPPCADHSDSPRPAPSQSGPSSVPSARNNFGEEGP